MSNTARDIDNMDPVLKKAERLQLQLSLEVQFRKNLEYFQEKLPHFYEEFKDYKPENQQLYIDDNNHVNLINIESKELVYKEDPKEIAKGQLKEFIKKPLEYTFKKFISTEWNDNHIHFKIMNESIRKFKEIGIEDNPSSIEKIGFMIVTGYGLGYQITELIDNLDIQNMVIYDSEKDSFYASLFTTDWGKIVNHFLEKKGGIYFYTAIDIDEAMANLTLIRSSVGLFNMLTAYIFVHTINKDTIKFYKEYRKAHVTSCSNEGFYDDEQISFSHTVENLKNNYPILKNHKKNTEKMPPALLIANGPSLDSLIEKIKEIQDYTILISCGTALGSLYKAGIKPDIHVEMERSEIISQWVEHGTDKEYRESIPLFCLNTVSPSVTTLFKHVFLAAKANDLGARIIQTEYPKNNIHELEWCNPSVSNFGLALAKTLGFKKVYLMGADFGMTKKNEHHSKNSLHFESESKDPKKSFIKKSVIPKTVYEVKGNFKEKVYTNVLFNFARKSIEILLMKNKDLQCFNPNNGAYIEGSKTINPEDINIKTKKKINKEKMISNIFEKQTFKPTKNRINKDYIKEKYILQPEEIPNYLTLNGEVDNIKDLHKEITTIFYNLKTFQRINPFIFSLFDASTENHLAMLFSYCARAQTKEEFDKCYKLGVGQLKKFVDTAVARISSDEIFKLDDMPENQN
ncbi:MAG: motility associated factor glycosyltransferase family protein [Cellvibrionaceae bacterium]